MLFFLVLASCNRETRDFEWPDEIAQLTGKDLATWLRKAPFSNELSQSDDDKMVFTNAAQVFPYMGRYNNAIGVLEYSHNSANNPIYQQETVLFKDPDWGDLFLHATLLYDAQEIFLDQHYSESGNIAFDGVDAGMNRYSATLTETGIFAKTDTYKTGIYWASSARGECLLGLYQKDNLIFEAAIPLLPFDTAATLAKLNAVNEQLGLGIVEWQQATVAQLKPVETPETFWRDPFIGIYPEERYLLNKVHLKIKDTPFQLAPQAVKGDYFFSYDTPGGEVELYTELEDTDDDRHAFDDTNQHFMAYDANGQHVYYEEQEVGGRIKGVAKTYFRSGQYLKINFTYPGNDRQAKAQVHEILKHIKVSSIL